MVNLLNAGKKPAKKIRSENMNGAEKKCMCNAWRG